MTIILKNGFYYLRYSYRTGDKVVTKEHYLGKTIPKNIDTLNQELMKEHKKELLRKLESIRTNFQREWKKTPASAKEKELQEIAIAFTYNTNAIEGSTITLEETRTILHDNIAPAKSLYDIKETLAHEKVFLAMMQKHTFLTEQLLLKWHQQLFDESKNAIAGSYREYLVRVGSYLAPDWQDVKKLMKDMFTWYKKNKTMNPVELAGRMHYKFEAIHPFGDGNGRVGRLLMSHILWWNDYPVLIIEYKKRLSYHKAFSGEERFVKYFVRRYVSAHKNFFL